MRTSQLANVRAALLEDEDDNFGDDLHHAVYGRPTTVEPSTDGDWTDGDPFEAEVDEDDRRYAAENFNEDTEGYTVEGEPDGSAIELHTVSAWDRLLDDLADDREQGARYELGCFAY